MAAANLIRPNQRLLSSGLDARTSTIPSFQLAEKFEKLSLLTDISSDFSDDYGQQNDLASRTQQRAVQVAYERNIWPLLESLFPRSALEAFDPHSGNADLAQSRLSSAHIRLLVSAATNNLAGMGSSLTQKDIYDYFQPMVGQFFNSNALVNRTSHFDLEAQALRPMAETLFRGAIEACDHVGLERILTWEGTGIDVNKQVCVVDGQDYTPVERSAALQCVAVTKLLIHFGADVNRSSESRQSYFPLQPCCAQDSRGALWNACIHPSSTNHYEQGVLRENVDEWLLATIIQAQGTICSSNLRFIVSECSTEIAVLLVTIPTPAGCKARLEAGVFHEIAYRLDETRLGGLLTWMYQQSLDLNTAFTYFDPSSKALRGDAICRDNLHILPKFPPNLLDIATERGALGVVKLLREWQINMTESTLVAAFRSGNVDLVHYIIGEGGLMHCFSRPYRITPFAEAIRLGNDASVRILMQRYHCLDDLDNEDHACAALAAAAETGNTELLGSFLERPGCKDSKILGYALSKAIETDRTDIALRLLETGASTNTRQYLTVFGFEVGTFYQPPCISLLSNAAKNRNQVLVRALLDHDALAMESDFGPTTVVLAAEWGHTAVLHDIIRAGGDPWYAVPAVLKTGNRQLFELILRGNLCLNNSGNNIWPETETPGFWKAVFENGCGDMLRTFISFTKDIFGAEAIFIAAIERQDPLLDYLIALCQQRYPNGHRSALGRTLRTAMTLNRKDVLQRVIESGFWGELELMRGFDDISAFGTAIEAHGHDRPEFTEVFLNSGLDPDSIIGRTYDREEGSHEFQTALLAAVNTKNAHMVQLLLDRGANINYPATLGVKRTPLQKAAEVGSKAMIELLISRGADIKAAPAVRGGATPIQLAAIGGFIGIFELLIRRGDDPWAPGCKVYGRTALEGAAEHGRFDMVKYLCDLGPHEQSQYDSAVQYANQKGHAAVAALLERMREQNRSPFEYPEGRVLLEAGPSCAQAQVVRYVCGECGKPLSNASALRRHETTVHRNEESDFKFRCADCGFGTNRNDTFDRHKATHAGETHQCSTCEATFSRSDTLNIHIRSCQAMDVDDNA